MVFLVLLSLIFTIFLPIHAFGANESDTVQQIKKDEFTLESSNVRFGAESTGIKKYAINFLFPGTAFRETNRYKNVAYKSVDFIAFSSLIYFAIKRNSLIRDAKSFAGVHAGIYPQHGTDFLYNMSESMSLSAHNRIMLLQANVSGERDRNYFLDQMYDETENYSWQWDSEENFNIYRNIISDHKRNLNYMYAFLGVLILNRVVSLLDFHINSRVSFHYSNTNEMFNFFVVVAK